MTTLSDILSKLQSRGNLIRPIVPVEQWINDPYYVGTDAKKLYPYWKEAVIDIFSGGQKYNEVIITGAIGIGKTTVALFIFLRKLYELSCYTDISQIFHLMNSSYTVFVFLTVSKFQAQRTAYHQFQTMVDSIPYFQNEFKRDQISSFLRFPQDILFIYGSSSNDVIGMNLIGSLLDEANFYGLSSKPNSDVYSKVIDLHETLIARHESRFKTETDNHSISLLVSSNTYKSSYTERRIANSANNPKCKVLSGRLWDVKPPGTYSEERFYVFIGTDKVDPFIIESVSLFNEKMNSSFIDSMTVAEFYGSLPYELKKLVDLVPIDFYNLYKTNIIKALQDISGIAISSQGKLFTSHSLFGDALIDGYNLFSKYEFTITTGDDSSENTIQHYLSGQEFEDPSLPHYIHIDQSTSHDSTGFACCHKKGTRVIDGKELPVFVLDFALRIDPPPPPKKISISRVRSFIYYMRDTLHINIAYISYDQFQSSESRQTLADDGFPVGYLSVDRTAEQYLFYCNLFYDGRIKIPRSNAPIIEKELFELDYYRERNKVDHTTTSTKDIHDGIVGALWNANTHQGVCVNVNDVLDLGRYNSSYDELPSEVKHYSLLEDYLDF